jgi:RNA polymerase sigma-70 factor (ECF subfamily)
MVQVMPDRATIHDLIRDAQAGDSDAFAALTTIYRQRLEAIAAARMSPAIRRRIAVEDVVQEVYTRALESLDRFTWRGDDSFLRWLGTIARNVITRHARERGGSSDLEIGDRLPGSGTSPSRQLGRKERKARLGDALEKLSPEQHEAIRLVRLDGLKIREAAERMGKSEAAVQQLLVRALRSLRSKLGDTASLRLPDPGDESRPDAAEDVPSSGHE